MDKTTLATDRKFIRNIVAGTFCAASLVLFIVLLISRDITGYNWIPGDLESFEVLTYIAIAAMVYIIGIAITYVVGVKTNYTDCFRVRRSYAYEIRKRSVMIYSPIGALIVCIIKSGSEYIPYDGEAGYGTIILFFIVAFLLYTAIIAAAVTFLLGISKLGYIVTIGILPWIFTIFASFEKIPVYLGVWNIYKAAILCLGMFILWLILLKRLKRVCYNANMY